MKRIFAIKRTCVIATVACLTVTWAASPVTAQELLGYWQFEETSVDDAAADSSGNGHDGEYEGEVDPSVDGAPPWAGAAT